MLGVAYLDSPKFTPSTRLQFTEPSHTTNEAVSLLCRSVHASGNRFRVVLGGSG